MKILSLSIKNFRNYKQQKADFHPEVNVIVGYNAHGKSNLLEAINYLSFFSSFRNARDMDMVRWGQSYFFIEGLIKKTVGEYHLSLGYNVDNKVLKINGNQQKKSAIYWECLTASFLTRKTLTLLRPDQRPEEIFG